MRRVKLGVLGLVSMFVLSLGLDTSIQKENSSPQSKNAVLYSSEHGRTV
jgi:hypothetical protein